MSATESKPYTLKRYFTTVVISLCLVLLSLGYFTYLFTQQVQSVYKVQDLEKYRMEVILEKLQSNHQSNLDQKIIESVDTHFMRMEESLHMTIENLQHELSILSFWAGVITIVFLVFSLYSIFKTDQMLTQAAGTLHEIHKSQIQADKIIAELERKQEDELVTLSQKINSIEQRAITSMQRFQYGLQNGDISVRPEDKPLDSSPECTSFPLDPQDK